MKITEDMATIVIDRATCHGNDGLPQKNGDSKVGSASPLGLFMANLMKARLATPADSPPSHPPTLNIVQDHARAFQRCHSRSFRRAQQEHKLRRSTYPIDLKKISRWESFPHSQKEETQRHEAKPQRRLSPTPASNPDTLEERRSRTRDVLHRALQEVDQACMDGSFSSHPSSTSPGCTAWLEVVATHDSYSPKPAPRCALELNKEDNLCLPARKNSGEQVMLLASSAGGKAAKRTAALTKRSGPPRRPQRQASLTNVKQAVLSLDEESICSAPAVVCVSDHSHSRPRRHSDLSPQAHQQRPLQGRHTRHSVPPMMTGREEEGRAKQQGCEDVEEASSEWHGICARSA